MSAPNSRIQSPMPRTRRPQQHVGNDVRGESSSSGSEETAAIGSIPLLPHQGRQYQQQPYRAGTPASIASGTTSIQSGGRFERPSKRGPASAASRQRVNATNLYVRAPGGSRLSGRSPESSLMTGSTAVGSSRYGADSSLSNYKEDMKDSTRYHLDPGFVYFETGKEDDDYLHNPDGKEDSRGCNLLSWRGIVNFAVLTLLILGLLALFAGYPLISYYENIFSAKLTATPVVVGTLNFTNYLPSLIDADTPDSAQAWTNPKDDSTYHLVFSDEFEVEGRTFWAGDDPYWEAVNLWYGVTGDLEWYSPEAVNTTGGYLQITMEEKINHNLYFQSGMVQSWNKFCFQGGYIEASVILPGAPTGEGWWPGIWMMGNLGRPGYPGSTDGMWPYSYNSCDTGILPNQSYVNQTGPSGARKLSYLPGMKASSCTCPGEDHPGPNVNVGRSSPEIDILEAQTASGQGEASQSLQVAPFDPKWHWDETEPAAVLADDTISHYNTYTGGVYQEALSGLTNIPDDAYELADTPRAVRFGVQYDPDWNGDGSTSITWFVDGVESWTVTGAAIGPQEELDISQRIIPTEPMSLIMNFGSSQGFQTVVYDTLQFPAKMRVDYIRVYQRDGQDDRISCDPPDHPTAQYIADHYDIYYNQNYTVYPRETYGWPKNQLTGC